MKNDLTKGLESDLKLILDNSKTDFSSYIPKENLAGLMVGKLNFKGINQLLKDKNASGLANERLAMAGITVEDITAAIDGDVAIAMNPAARNGKTNALVLMKIGQKPALDKLLNKGIAMGLLQKSNNNLYAVKGDFLEVNQILVQGDMLFLSNDAILLNKLSKGQLAKSDRIEAAKYAEVNGVLGFLVDFSLLSSEMTNNPSAAMEKMTMNLDWDESKATVIMKDKSKNALKALVETWSETYQERQNRRNKTEKDEKVVM
jgi:hypothetical protein